MYLVSASDAEFAKLWSDLQIEGEHFDALYGEANLAYYREYCGNPDIEDLSFLVSDGEVALCGIRAFRRSFEQGSSEISCFGLPLLYAEHQHVDAAMLARAKRHLRFEIEKKLQEQSIGTTIYYKDRLHRGCISLLGRLLLDYGGDSTVSVSQIIDLSLTEETLHKGMTKAYKWSVNWGRKNLAINVLDRNSITSQDIENFRLLHFEAAGRETRTLKSWTLQYEMVLKGEAFCVFARMGESLVSAALFPYSKSHCFYGVSASRRDLFDKPLNHSVIWTALLHSKMLGLRYFEMGEQLFPMAPRPHPTQKELGISFFKRAFGGESRVFLDICLKLQTSPVASLPA
jgi:hypothetical protein